MLLAIWLPGSAVGHGSLSTRIAELDGLIETGPVTAELLIKRAELHRVHKAWSLAALDLDRAESLRPNDDMLSFYRGRLWLESGEPDRAALSLSDFLARHPDDSQALLLRARAFARLERAPEGARDLERAIERVPSPTPELYLEHARLLAGSGVDDADAALRAIDAGLQRLGPIVSLVEFAVSHELIRTRYGSALAYLDRLPPALASRPVWLVRRAEILELAGERREAIAAVRAARTAVERLPSSRRRARAALDTEARLGALESRLE